MRGGISRRTALPVGGTFDTFIMRPLRTPDKPSQCMYTFQWRHTVACNMVMDGTRMCFRNATELGE